MSVVVYWQRPFTHVVTAGEVGTESKGRTLCGLDVSDDFVWECGASELEADEVAPSCRRCQAALDKIAAGKAGGDRAG